MIEVATLKCPQCDTVNRMLADEIGDHLCWKCGLEPWGENEKEAVN